MYALILLIIIALVIMLLAARKSALILLNHLKIRKELESSAKWPNVTGQITSSTVEKAAWYPQTPRGSRAYGPSFIYHPSVEYIFTVKDVTHYGNRIMFGSNIGTKRESEARTIVRRYTETESVTVYYDPEGPASAILERRLADFYRRAIFKETVRLALILIAIMLMPGLYFLTAQ